MSFQVSVRGRAEHGVRRRAAGADREGDDAFLAMAVVGDDAPAHAVVAVLQAGAQAAR